MPYEVKKEDAQYAHDTVKRIIDEAGPGAPCTAQERARAEIIKEEMEGITGKGNVDIEEFTCAPGAMFGWLKIGVGLAIISLALHFMSFKTTGSTAVALSVASFLFSLLIVVMGVFEFMLMREFVDPILPKKKSQNVVGKIKSQGETKRIVVFSGHHDSAIQFTWARYLKLGYYLAVAIIFWAILSLSVRTGLYAAGLIVKSHALTSFGEIGWRTLAIPIIPYMIFSFFFVGSRKNGGKVPGAADNLSGCCLTLTIGRILKDNPGLIPENTEVRLITFGSEEAGMRGSNRYVERHLNELKEKDTTVFNIDTVNHEVMYILKSDCNGFLKYKPELVGSVATAARNADVPYKVLNFPFGAGGTDANRFNKRGIKAVTLMPCDFPIRTIKWYHQSTDNMDVISIEPFMNLLKVATEWLKLIDTPQS